MKKLLALLLVGAGSYAPVFASPYFRPLNLPHPVLVGGALLATDDIKNTSAVTLIPLVTHSPADGCLLPSIVCEDWSPVAIGGSINAGKLTFDIGPIANMLPWVQNFGKLVIPQGWFAIRNVVDYNPTGDPITFSAGPMWEYQQATDKGYLKIFTGLALHF